ncbi:MAG: (2Fe-2S) ferredoxin domain-containing protein, partial [bacterium]|nr:(2Fe-2S) ferredoxin domain-containing protein [bacterium]
GRAPDFVPALREEIERRGLSEEVRVVETGCRGFCSMGPVLTIEPPGTFYTNLTAADVPQIVEETLIKGRVINKLLYKEPTGRKTVQHAGGTILPNGLTQHFGYKEEDRGQWDEERDVEYVTGCSIAIPMRIFEEFGLYDDRYFPT